LNQINPIHTIPSYLSKIHFNIVHPPTSRYVMVCAQVANGGDSLQM
jgi:hypothetical protein